MKWGEALEGKGGCWMEKPHGEKFRGKPAPEKYWGQGIRKQQQGEKEKKK